MSAPNAANTDHVGKPGQVLLEFNDVYAGYGKSRVLHGISLSVPRGETVCLLGRNGAGKTTTLRTAIGIVSPTAGNVRLSGHEMSGRPSHVFARRGIGYAPEDRRIIPGLTVTQNLSLARSALGTRDGPSFEDVYSLFPKLRELAATPGTNLSGGEQQMLTVARALMGAPEVLLLDEPTEGLAPIVVEELQAALREIVRTGRTVLFAEQRTDFVLSLADHAYLIERGLIRFSGTVNELRERPELLKRYVGVG